MALPNTIYYSEAMSRSVAAEFATERFLSSYHLLELQFNTIIVSKITGLGSDLNGVNRIFSQFGTKELPRLKWILKESCVDWIGIACALDNISRYLSNAKKCFFDFEEEGGPIPRYKVLVDLIGNGGFTVDALNLTLSINSQLRGDFNGFVCDVASRWIYKIRCSVAHRKIGEYIISSNDDEFIENFGRPLLRELLIQVFGLRAT